MRQKVTSKKVTWKASGHPLYHVHLWMHLYQVWRKHRPLPACFTHSQEGQLQRNAPKTASPVSQRFISCHLVVFFHITHLSLPQFIWMPAWCVSESFHQKSPSRTLLQLKKISSLASVLAPDTTVAREEATGNPSQPCSKQKQVFLFCMRTGRPVQQASQIGRAISVLWGFQHSNDKAPSNLFWSHVWSCFEQQTQLETYNLNYSMSFYNLQNLLNLNKWLLLRAQDLP